MTIEMGQDFVEKLHKSIADLEQSLEDLRNELEQNEDQITDDNRITNIAHPDYEYYQDEDERVAVDKDALPDYIGATGSDGVLRVGLTGVSNGLGYADGGNFVTLTHYDTSSVANANLADGVVFATMTFDEMGHVTAYTTKDLDDRYYTEGEIDTTFGNYYTKTEVDTLLGNLTYIGLADTYDANYTGHYGDVPMVRGAEDGLELATFGTFAEANGYTYKTIRVIDDGTGGEITIGVYCIV